MDDLAVDFVVRSDAGACNLGFAVSYTGHQYNGNYREHLSNSEDVLAVNLSWHVLVNLLLVVFLHLYNQLALAIAVFLRESGHDSSHLILEHISECTSDNSLVEALIFGFPYLTFNKECGTVSLLTFNKECRAV